MAYLLHPTIPAFQTLPETQNLHLKPTGGGGEEGKGKDSKQRLICIKFLIFMCQTWF